MAARIATSCKDSRRRRLATASAPNTIAFNECLLSPEKPQTQPELCHGLGIISGRQTAAAVTPGAVVIVRCPVASADVADAVWIGDEPVPGILAGLDGFVMAVPDENAHVASHI